MIDLQKPITLSKNKTQIVKKGIPQHLTIEMTENFAPFWNTVLTPALAKSYDARPIHSIDEIALLANRFPANILQYQLLHDGECIAGITLFCNMKIIKTQYAATNEKGKKINALDYLYLYLTEKLKKEGYHYFDLGHTNIEDGYKYNTTLSRYKERIGGSPVNADCYLLSL